MTGGAAGFAEIGTLHRTAEGNRCTAVLDGGTAVLDGGTVVLEGGTSCAIRRRRVVRRAGTSYNNVPDLS
jgi:hypothetical protein